MFLKPLDIDLNGRLVITDIDDCLIRTTDSILENHLSKRQFWMDQATYQSNKELVFKMAEFTAWGHEFVYALRQGKIKSAVLLTSAKDRLDIIQRELFFDDPSVLSRVEILEGQTSQMKIDYLNQVKDRSIYVDDKTEVLKLITNKRVEVFQFPD